MTASAIRVWMMGEDLAGGFALRGDVARAPQAPLNLLQPRRRVTRGVGLPPAR